MDDNGGAAACWFLREKGTVAVWQRPNKAIKKWELLNSIKKKN